MSVELTEKLLQRAGGWQAWKEAKFLHGAGRVTDAAYQPPVLRGKVREGTRQYLAGLRIPTEREMENLCPCRDSRERGLICAHSLAVGLATLRDPIAAPPEPVPPQNQSSASSARQNDTSEQPSIGLELEGSFRSLEAQPRFKYANPGFRNPEAEERFEEHLRRSGFQKGRGGMWRLDTEDKVAEFLGSGLPSLQETAEVNYGPRLTEISRKLVRIEPQFALSQEGGGWLSVQVHFHAGTAALLSTEDVRRLLGGGRKWVELKDGRRALLNAGQFNDIQETFQDGDPLQEGGRYRFRDMHRGYLEHAISGWTGKDPVAHSSKADLGSMDKILRDYQKTGARWLLALAEKKWGGLLADDMGLGKTIQALAVMEVVGGLNLIICPSSLVWNWQREIERFLPGQAVRMIEGSGRLDLLRNIPEAGILISSYALLRRDIEAYRGIRFRTVFLDEAQHIKNPDSQNARSATALEADARFILTGTPVENSVRDLWSLFDFALPGYLGGKKDFEERYEKPLSVEGGNPAIAKRLARRIRPFVLRRLKRDVLTELPEKLEQVTYCQLTESQNNAYESLRRGALEKLDALRQNGATGATKMAVFTAILRLRQACCDLRLFGGKGSAEQTSSKLRLLMELLREAQDGGHRVLVFSQFTSMLELIAEQMNEEGFRYCRLEGGTKDRQGEVDRFQSDAGVLAFLISIKGRRHRLESYGSRHRGAF